MPKPKELRDYLLVSSLIHFTEGGGYTFDGFADALAKTHPCASLSISEDRIWITWRACASKKDMKRAFTELSDAWLALWILHPLGPQVQIEKPRFDLALVISEIWAGRGWNTQPPVEEWQYVEF